MSSKSHYLQGLVRRDIPKLSVEREHQLGHLIATGDTAALDELITHNLRIVPYMVSTKLTAWNHGSMPHEDILQIANEALILAAKRWKPQANIRFCTYAGNFIFRFVLRELNNTTNTIRLPVNIMQSIKKMNYNERALSQDLGRKPTIEELSAATNLSVNKIHQLRGYINREPISLESLEGENYNDEVEE